MKLIRLIKTVFISSYEESENKVELIKLRVVVNRPVLFNGLVSFYTSGRPVKLKFFLLSFVMKTLITIPFDTKALTTSDLRLHIGLIKTTNTTLFTCHTTNWRLSPNPVLWG